VKQLFLKVLTERFSTDDSDLDFKTIIPTNWMALAHLKTVAPLHFLIIQNSTLKVTYSVTYRVYLYNQTTEGKIK